MGRRKGREEINQEEGQRSKTQRKKERSQKRRNHKSIGLIFLKLHKKTNKNLSRKDNPIKQRENKNETKHEPFQTKHKKRDTKEGDTTSHFTFIIFFLSPPFPSVPVYPALSCFIAACSVVYVLPRQVKARFQPSGYRKHRT